MKNVLLYMVDFYQYRKDIVEELENQGYQVTWYLDEPKLSFGEKVINKLTKNYGQKKFNKYFLNSLEKEKNHHFDLVLVIFGANYMNSWCFKKIKETFPNTPLVYYAWDSVKNFPRIKELFESSDYAYTFDGEDAKKYHVPLLPLYFKKRIEDKDKVDPKYDVSTVMTFFIEKLDNLNHIISSLPEGVNKFIYLRIKDKAYYVKMLFKMRKLKNVKKYFTFDSISWDDNLKIFNESNAIIDCQLAGQCGLTMRTFEALAFKKKLITTNKYIKEYDFYSEDNIFIVENGNEKIPLEFLQTPYNDKYIISDQYHISKFIKRLTSHIESKEAK